MLRFKNKPAGWHISIAQYTVKLTEESDHILKTAFRLLLLLYIVFNQHVKSKTELIQSIQYLLHWMLYCYL